MVRGINDKCGKYELAVIMPVYNEETCIAAVVNSWLSVLESLSINFVLIVLNDGSRDSTASELHNFAENKRIRTINKVNSGHGPTILMGYNLAVTEADWVFQVDSDDELKPDSFVELWQRRDCFDALFGVRTGRSQSCSRMVISSVSRFLVSMVFGVGIKDVNIPYRLLRSNVLQGIISSVPQNSFATNILISGALTAVKHRIYNHPVPHENRKTGTVSIINGKLWKAAFISFYQTLAFRMQLKR